MHPPDVAVAVAAAATPELSHHPVPEAEDGVQGQRGRGCTVEPLPGSSRSPGRHGPQTTPVTPCLLLGPHLQGAGLAGAAITPHPAGLRGPPSPCAHAVCEREGWSSPSFGCGVSGLFPTKAILKPLRPGHAAPGTARPALRAPAHGPDAVSLSSQRSRESSFAHGPCHREQLLWAFHLPGLLPASSLSWAPQTAPPGLARPR